MLSFPFLPSGFSYLHFLPLLFPFYIQVLLLFFLLSSPLIFLIFLSFLLFLISFSYFCFLFFLSICLYVCLLFHSYLSLFSLIFISFFRPHLSSSLSLYFRPSTLVSGSPNVSNFMTATPILKLSSCYQYHALYDSPKLIFILSSVSVLLYCLFPDICYRLLFLFVFSVPSVLGYTQDTITFCVLFSSFEYFQTLALYPNSCCSLAVCLWLHLFPAIHMTWPCSCHVFFFFYNYLNIPNQPLSVPSIHGPHFLSLKHNLFLYLSLCALLNFVLCNKNVLVKHSVILKDVTVHSLKVFIRGLISVFCFYLSLPLSCFLYCQNAILLNIKRVTRQPFYYIWRTMHSILFKDGNIAAVLVLGCE